MAARFDLIVIGEGIAGLTCASRAAALGLRAATVESNVFGGLVINVAELEGYPDHGSGVDIASRLMEANADAGVTSLAGEATAISGSAGDLRVRIDGEEHGARAVVIASGARFNRLGVPGEEEYDHRGVSNCADCDGPMMQGEHAVVVGGGDSAFQEAATLAHFAARVTILMRGAKPRARAELAERVAAEPKITLVPNTLVEAIVGGTMVEGVLVRPAAGGDTSRIDCTGVFVFAGLVPNGAVAPAGVGRSSSGALETDAGFETAVRGVYAVGAVRAGYSGRLADAEAEARAAAQAVARALA